MRERERETHTHVYVVFVCVRAREGGRIEKRFWLVNMGI